MTIPCGLAALCFILLCSALSAQPGSDRAAAPTVPENAGSLAAEMDALLDSGEITYGQAARFILEAAERGWLPKNAHAPAAGFTAKAALGAALPTPFPDRLALEFMWASGKNGTQTAAFTPLTTEARGYVLKAKPSGIMAAGASYRARFLRPLSAELSAQYFFRTDDETFTRASGDSYLLGGELYGRLIWAPVSDISLVFGGGVFVPTSGGAYMSTALQYLVSAGLMISVY
ncbi:MAG: hypothetical protein LBQ57_12655 [Spirochaetales bacterium]|jgi:hypothetical protein|nr:hypothetical protein [Spirochaetales bacterium]